MSEVVLHFVRHGETTWNAERRIQGQTHDVPLSDRGREQAREVAQTLASVPAGAIYSSDLRRAIETAAPIAEALRLPVIEVPALRERHFGDLQGQRYEDVRQRMETAWRDPDLRVPGGESWRDAYDRVSRFLDTIRAAPPAPELVLVTHGGPLNLALTYLAGAGLESLTWERIDNCAVRTIVLPSGAPATVRLEEPKQGA
jgi:probable phosphoglycerate mutase